MSVTPCPSIEHVPEETAGRREILSSQAWGRLEELGFHNLESCDLTGLRGDIHTRIRTVGSETDASVRKLFDDSGTLEELRVSDLNARAPDANPAPRPRVMIFDEPLQLRSGIRYDFNGISVHQEQGRHISFLFEAQNVDLVVLEHLTAHLSSGTGFIRMLECRKVTVVGCEISGAFLGVVLRDDNHEVTIRGNILRDTTRAGILLQGLNEWVEIDSNTIVGTDASSNWAAGIVLSAALIRDPLDLTADFWPDLHWPIPYKVRTRIRCPRHILCTQNLIERSRTSGIFCDGTYLCVIADNTIKDCDKEGLCLDIGSCLTLVENNTILGNGKRARQTDADLTSDFVLWAGRTADGSARCKLPGISMDNSLFNIVRKNTVQGNAGGGVKMVRTCFLNWVDENIIEDNSSAGGTAWSFPGVLLEGSGADADTDEHDLLPCYGNVISNNRIARHEPAPGIIVRDDCPDNILYGNTINSNGLGIDARYAKRTRVQENNVPGGIMVYRPIYSPLRKVAGRVRRQLRLWLGRGNTENTKT